MPDPRNPADTPGPMRFRQLGPGQGGGRDEPRGDSRRAHRGYLTEDERVAARRPEIVGEILGRVMGGISRGRAAPSVVLGSAWTEVVGADLAERSRPGSCQDGRLIVLVRDGATASRMRFMTGAILRGAAEMVGEGVVERVAFRVSPDVGR